MLAAQDVRSTNDLRLRAAVWSYAAGTIAAGILDLIWGEFEAAHQPIQALGDHIPGRAVLAYLAAIWLIAGGVAILKTRLARAGALSLMVIYAIFAAFWLPRFYTAVHVLGFRFPIIVGIFSGLGQQLILVAAAAILYASANRNVTPLARWLVGLSSVAFGLAHLTGVQLVAAMVPKWLPFGGDFWARFTGMAFVFAGAAIVAQVLDLLASRLLALMLFLFSVLVLARAPLARPHDHIAWGSNAYNLAAVGAAWIFAETSTARKTKKTSER